MLFVPIWDMNHLKRVRFQYVTVGLIVLNTLIYFVFGTHLFLHSPASFVDALAFKPREVTSLHDFMEHVPEQFRLLTYMFMHGSVWHLLGNMVFLFVFGDNVEDALGHARFIVFYLLCGVIAAVVHSAVTLSPDVPLIGASGAIAGVIGAYVILHPQHPHLGSVSGPGCFVSAASVLGGFCHRHVDYVSDRQWAFPDRRSDRLVGPCWRLLRGSASRHCHEKTRRSPFRYGDRHTVIAGRMSNLRRIDSFAGAKYACFSEWRSK